MAKTRAQTLADVGLECIPDPTQRLAVTPLVRAMAAMIAKATEPKPKRARDPEAGADYRVGTDALNTLMYWAPGAVAWTPVQSRTIAALGRAAREMCLHTEDLQTLGGWLDVGGLSWMKEMPTTAYIARNLGDLVARSRAATPAEAQSALDKVRK